MPKSIDEAVIDFRGMERFLNRRSLEDIGKEIKQRLRTEIGEWMSCTWASEQILPSDYECH